MSDVDYEREPLDLATGAAHRVKLPPRVMRGRLTGFLFETAKTFLLPAALEGIKGLKTFYDAHPGLKVLVTGHTDTVDTPTYNRGLSEERADSVAAYLLDDVDVWLGRYQGSPVGKPWGTREDQYMLSALPDGEPPYYAGPIHGALDAATQDAVKRFQADHGCAVDGVPGPETRRALVTAYMAIDGTSLPAGTEMQQHGCGEHHPAVPTPDETEEQENRRVEVFFFEGPIEPPPQKPCPTPGCPEYPEWLRRTILTIDFTLEPPVLSDPRWEEHEAETKAVNVRLYDDRAAACADHPATVIAGDQRWFVRTDGRGAAEVKVPAATTELRVRYALPRTGAMVELKVVLEVGGPDETGAKKRLINLGYPIEQDPHYAIFRFQRDFEVSPPTSKLDAVTIARIVEVHDA